MKEIVSKFDSKNLGYIKYFLGIEVSHSTNDTLISQENYVLDLLYCTRFTNFQPVKTSSEVNHCLAINDSEPSVDIGRYLSLLGRSIYLVQTHLDSSYVINIIKKFTHSPRISHLKFFTSST